MPIPTPTPVPCIPSGDEQSIQQALTGDGAKALLCPGAVFELSVEVGFTADGQEIATQGLPTDDTRALLRVVGADTATAVHSNGFSGITLRNVIIDGNRPALGIASGGLMEFGGVTTGQLIENVKAYEPRGWSVLVINEGHDHLCRNVTARFNELGPAGSAEYIIADGISLACRDATVTDNVIVDATDGGIVIFQAPGSLVARNTIRAETRVMFYAISMVDYGPFDGDFTGTVVDGNTIDAAGALIRHGIDMGPSVGCMPVVEITEISRGATVTNNVLTGTHMGYGFVVSGVEDWTVTGNVDNSTREPFGSRPESCFEATADEPSSFQLRASHAGGTFQDDFAPATFGWSTDWWPSDAVVDTQCAASMIGESTLASIRDGERGQLWPAIEAAEGGRRIAQCLSPFDAPARPSEQHVQVGAEQCGPTCIRVDFINLSDDRPADMTNATFLLESFLVDCAGLPATLASLDSASCTIEDYVTEGFQVLRWYGFPYLGDSGWGIEVVF